MFVPGFFSFCDVCVFYRFCDFGGLCVLWGFYSFCNYRLIDSVLCFNHAIVHGHVGLIEFSLNRDEFCISHNSNIRGVPCVFLRQICFSPQDLYRTLCVTLWQGCCVMFVSRGLLHTGTRWGSFTSSTES